ncbi:hypothetical protein BH23VER1_BH23VER1_11230 [soil metagenome]
MTEIEVLLNRRYLSDEEGVSGKTRALLAGEQFCEIMTFDRETVLIEEGAPQNDLYFTLQGLFHASSVRNPRATHRLLGRIQPAEFIGEVSVIDGTGTASATVKAMQDAMVLRMPQESFQLFCEEYPTNALEFLRAIAKQLCDRLRKANES